MAHLGDQTILRVFAKHEPYADGQLDQVIEEMHCFGEPTIRCVEWRGEIFALEGSHRLAAAHRLGLIPKIVVVPPDRLGWDDEAALEEIRNRIPAYAWLISENEIHPGMAEAMN